MKTFLVTINFLIFSIVSFSQTKPKVNSSINPNPQIDVLLKKIVKYTIEDKLNDDYGVAIMGRLSGYSSFDFPILSKNKIQLKISYQIKDYYNVLGKQFDEIGELKNINFKNAGGKFNTKIIIADWVTNNKNRHGTFNLKIPDLNKNDIYISVFNESPYWEFYDRIKLSNSHFQDIINDLSISGKIDDLIKERDYQLKKDSILKDSIEKIKGINIEYQLKKDSILNTPQFDNPIKIGNLLVTKTDYKNNLTFRQLNIFMDKFSNGWRLPSEDELILMKKYIPEMNGYYWGVRNDGSLRDVINVNDKGKFPWGIENDDKFPVRLVKGYLDSTFLIYKLTANAIKFDNILVSSIDLPKLRNSNTMYNELDKAIYYCKNVLGDGWMIPTFIELNKIYESRQLLPDLKDNYLSILGGYDNSLNAIAFSYDTNLESYGFNNFIYYKNFSENGKYFKEHLYAGDTLKSKIRLVKRNDFQAKTGKTIEIGNLITTDILFPLKLNWYQAKLAVQDLGSGWRLPTIDELKNIFSYYSNYADTDLFMKERIWSSSPADISDGDIMFNYPSIWTCKFESKEIKQYIKGAGEECYFIPVKSK